MRLDVPMTENIIAALVHLEVGGTIIRMMGDDVAFLPDDYRVIVERLIVFWKQWKKPPGPHAVDEFRDVMGRPDSDRQKQFLIHVLNGALAIKDGLSPEYVIGRLGTYMRVTAITGGVLGIAQYVHDHGESEEVLLEVERMLNQLLRARRIEFDPGLQPERHPGFY